MEQVEVKRPHGPPFKVRVFAATSIDRLLPTLVLQPAMGVRAAYYDPFAEALSHSGFNVIVSELRGTGESGMTAGRNCDFGYWDMVRDDWPAVLELAERRFGKPVALLGHSLGAQINMIYAALNPGRIAALISVAASSVHYKTWPRGQRLGMLGFTQTAALTARALGYFPGHRFRFAGRESRSVIGDWARLSRTGRFQLANCPHDVEAALASLHLPALAISIEGDGLAPSSAVDGLVAKMPKADVTRWHFSPLFHGMRGIDHFRWVKQPEPIVSQMYEWLARQQTKDHI